MEDPRPESAIIQTLIDLGYEDVLGDVCRHHGIDPEIVCSRRRTRAISLARHELYWRLRNLALTYDQIGAIFRRQHSTIVRGIIAFRRSPRGLMLAPPRSHPALKPLARRAAAPPASGTVLAHAPQALA